MKTFQKTSYMFEHISKTIGIQLMRFNKTLVFEQISKTYDIDFLYASSHVTKKQLT